MTKRRQHGFTIVELIVVIIIIAILAAITSVLYMGAQKQARDIKNIDGMHQVADAIQLFISKNQHFPLGGYGSNAVIGAGTECTKGASGFAGHGMYTCTVEDTLVASGYLPAGFIAGLSPNKVYGSYPDGRASIMVYATSATTAMVMTSMESPTAQDTANFSTQLTKCLVPAGNYAPRDSWGMANGVCITFSTP